MTSISLARGLVCVSAQRVVACHALNSCVDLRACIPRLCSRPLDESPRHARQPLRPPSSSSQQPPPPTVFLSSSHPGAAGAGPPPTPSAPPLLSIFPGLRTTAGLHHGAARPGCVHVGAGQAPRQAVRQPVRWYPRVPFDETTFWSTAQGRLWRYGFFLFLWGRCADARPLILSSIFCSPH